jgi:LysM repeat protein
MKKVLILSLLPIILLLFPARSNANPDSVGVTKKDGKNYLLHKVESAEGWYSIARHYGISYAELRMANKDSSDHLLPGMEILVPLERPQAGDPFYDKNYVQKKEDLFHSVKSGETLFSIAKHFSTSVDSLKKWNNLSDVGLKTGQKLKVGYKTKGDETVNAGKGSVTKNVAVGAAKTNSSVAEKSELKISTVDSSKLNTNKLDTSKSAGDSTKMIKTASGMKGETKKSPATLTGKGRKEITETGIASWIRDDDINPNKYYALHRTAPIGTIIRVMNKMNSKYVFVKVVGTLPDTGDNTDLVIKISKASAEKLGVRDSKFQSELSYGITEKK